MALTERDAAVILRVFQCRAVPAQATFLFAHAFDPSGGGDNWSKRLRMLYDAGWLSRFYLPQSQYLAGSQWPIYVVETGVAARASELRRAWRGIDRPTRARLTAASASSRDQLLRLLTSRHQLEPGVVAGALRASTDLALKLYSGEPCHIQHVLLCATMSAILWHGLDAPPTFIASDGTLDLSDAGADPLLPDMFFVTRGAAVCIEAETGASSRAKIREKLTRYRAVRERLGALNARLGIAIDRIRVIFHCATVGHKNMVANLIAEQAPCGTAQFLLSDSTSLHLDFPQLYYRRNTPIAFGNDDAKIPFYEALKSLTRRAVFAQVEGSEGGAAVVGFVSFEEGVAR
jgi:hypothetical protein